ILNIMLTWRDGRKILAQRMREIKPPVYKAEDGSVYLKQVAGTSQLFDNSQHLNTSWLPMEILSGDIINNQKRVSGTSVFMSVSLTSVPPVLIHHLKHNKVLHENVLFLSIKSLDMPYAKKDKRIELSEMGNGFFRILAYYGFMETPNVPDIIKKAQEQGLKINDKDITYYLGRESLLISNKSKMLGWKKSLFAFMSKNALPATSYFSIPPDRVVELGIQIEL
ncbi:MAG: KUP/HAK/KT family potassium transporter, partial [Candidatus Sericytochromatia bacterium]